MSQSLGGVYPCAGLQCGPGTFPKCALLVRCDILGLHLRNLQDFEPVIGMAILHMGQPSVVQGEGLAVDVPDLGGQLEPVLVVVSQRRTQVRTLKQRRINGPDDNHPPSTNS
jgi:hypothetical protein